MPRRTIRVEAVVKDEFLLVLRVLVSDSKLKFHALFFLIDFRNQTFVYFTNNPKLLSAYGGNWLIQPVFGLPNTIEVLIFLKTLLFLVLLNNLCVKMRSNYSFNPYVYSVLLEKVAAFFLLWWVYCSSAYSLEISLTALVSSLVKVLYSS